MVLLIYALVISLINFIYSNACFKLLNFLHKQKKILTDKMDKKVGVLSKIVSIESVFDNDGEKVTVRVKRITRVLLKNPKFAENKFTAEVIINIF